MFPTLFKHGRSRRTSNFYAYPSKTEKRDTPMDTTETQTPITFRSFFVAWGMVVLLAYARVPELLDRSLVPAPALLILAEGPVIAMTAVVQWLVIRPARALCPEWHLRRKLLIYLITAPLTVLILWLLILPFGGPEFLIPRI